MIKKGVQMDANMRVYGGLNGGVRGAKKHLSDARNVKKCILKINQLQKITHKPLQS